MMVLRHLSASAAGSGTTGPVGCRNENTGGGEEERVPIPMDLSKSSSKPGHTVSEPSSDLPLPLNLNKGNSYGLPSLPIRPLSSSSRSSENIINNNTITNNNNIDLSAKNHHRNSNNIYKSDSPVNFSTRPRSSPSQSQTSNQISSGPTTPQFPNSNHNPPLHHQHHRRSRKADLRWRELSLVHHGSSSLGEVDDDGNTFSSPDSGLHRDSPGEEDEVTSTKPLSPSSNWRSSPSSTSTSSNHHHNHHNNNNINVASFLRKQAHPNLIPLSLIRAKYNHTNVSPDRFPSWEEDEQMSTDRVKIERDDVEGGGRRSGDKVQTKRARLEEMVSQIKTTKDTRVRNYSGDDDSSSGGQVTSSDEVLDDGPADLRNISNRNSNERRGRRSGDKGGMIGYFNNNVRKEKVLENFSKQGLNMSLMKQAMGMEEEEEDEDDYVEEDGNEPCNLAYPKSSSSPPPMIPRPEGIDIEQWKKAAQMKSTSPFPLSPTDAAKLYGIDPDTYQQQIMQLQLTSMLGDPSALLKALGSYPPWVYMGYYSQLLQSFQAQEILRQYAIQSGSSNQSSNNNGNSNLQGGDKTPPSSTMRSTVASSTNYHSQSSPLSPASVNEGTGGIDSDGSAVGPNTPGLNGKRAPRAMTGRHVRTGTGASPSTLLTLRQKIEERQRVKAQQAKQEALLNSQAKSAKNGNSKFSRKSGKAK